MLLVNLALSFLFILAFGVSSVYSGIRLREETERHSQQILDTLTENYHAESIRLSSFLKLCATDRSFIMGISNRLTVKEFVQYSMQVSEKLSIMQYSLPYAENVYAYVKNNGMVIQPRSVVVGQELFLQSLQSRAQGADGLPDFGSLGDGFHRIGNGVFYIHQYYDYGTLLIKVDADRFCRLDEVGAVLSDYKIIVLDPDGAYFAGNGEALLGALGDVAFGEDFQTELTIEGDTYGVRHTVLSDGFHFLLLENRSAERPAGLSGDSLPIAGAFVLFLGSALLVYLNAQIYRPLKKLTRQYAEGEKRNEFELIHAKIDEMIEENQRMQTQIQTGQRQKSDLELRYALLSRTRIGEKLAGSLRKQYGRCRVVTVTIQKMSAGAELLGPADDYFADALEAKAIPAGPAVHAYLVPGSLELKALVAVLEGYFESLEDTAAAFAGVSDLSDNFVQLHTVYRQSFERLLSNPAWGPKPYAIFCETDGVAGVPRGTNTGELIDRVAQATLDGKPDDVRKALGRVFSPACSPTLRETASCCTQLTELLITLSSRSGSGVELPAGGDGALLYHPAHMREMLLQAFLTLNAAVSPKETAMRYEVVDYINQHYREPLSLDSISSFFGITPIYLSSWFKKNIGINLSAYLTNVRMKAAEQAIRENPHVKMAEVAAQVGVPNMTTFTRQFKNTFGCTPEQFRQRQKG